jgi:hypothetical protein
VRSHTIADSLHPGLIYDFQTPVHDLRFTTARDLLEAVAKLNKIGIVCSDDDEDLAAVPRSESSMSSRPGTSSPAFLAGVPGSQPSIGSRSQTTSPGFFLSAEMMKAGRVMSPLERRPDGSTPPFYLVRVPKSGRSTPTVGTPEVSRKGPCSPQLSRESHSTLARRRDPKFTSKPGSDLVESTRHRPRAEMSRQESTLSLLSQESQSVLPPSRELNTTLNSASVSAFGSRNWPMTQLSQKSQLMLPPRRDLSFTSKQDSFSSRAPTDSSTTQQSRQELSSPQLSQESGLMPPRRELDFTSKPTSVPVMVRRESSASQLQSISPEAPLPTPISFCSSLPSIAKSALEHTPAGSSVAQGFPSSGRPPHLASTTTFETWSSLPSIRRQSSQSPRQNHKPQQETAAQLPSFQIPLTHSPDTVSGSRKLQRPNSTAYDDMSSSQPAKRRRVAQVPSRKRSSRGATGRPVLPDPQPLAAQGQDANAGVDQFSQRSQKLPVNRPNTIYGDGQARTDNQNQINAAMAKKIGRGYFFHQVMIWEEHRDALVLSVETAGDDDQALKKLVENYEKSLSEGLSRTLDSYL